YEGFETSVSIAHLENRLAAAYMLGAGDEFRIGLGMYAKRIGAEGLRGKVEELLKGLMGGSMLFDQEDLDADEEEEGERRGGAQWQWGGGDEILGWKREDLLREVVVGLGRQRELQRVTVPYARFLGILDTLPGGEEEGGQGSLHTSSLPATMSSTPREEVYTQSSSKEPPLNLHQLKQNMPHAVNNGEPEFSAPAQTHQFAALLFDMDGTIIDSTPAIVKYWHALGDQIGVPGAQILETSHGRRSIDVLALLAPEKANWEFVCEAEGRVPLEYGSDAVEIPGARALLETLEKEGVPWAIVTSGTRPLVEGWLGVMKLARPGVLVSAEEVAKGKPDPACYRLGAQRLGFEDGSAGAGQNGDAGDGAVGAVRKVNPDQILVLEDAPAGVRAGKAAGYKVVALATTHAIEKLREAGADWIVEDMRSVSMMGWEAKAGRVGIEIKNALTR
ncbi:hypothetical protein B0A55_09142, partial [Friedmanniomyces simplex]